MRDTRKPHELPLPLGHEYGAGRKQEAHKDRRSKRLRTRAAKQRKAVHEGW